MAKLIAGDKEFELKDGESIKECCKKLGVAFSCETGTCATCMVEVAEGMDNLSEKSEAEEFMPLEENYRLACQCKIKKGTVKLNF